MENTKDDIRTQSNTKNAEVVRKNREILSSVIKCVILCGRQNLPLRGHRDDSQHVGDKNTNSGNFQALLDFRIDSGEVNLKRYLENCPRNATYRSKTIQNKIIDCIKDCIVDDLLAESKTPDFIQFLLMKRQIYLTLNSYQFVSDLSINHPTFERFLWDFWMLRPIQVVKA
ncbi:unnamed protein product [Mytilus edulis]|uniref:DUF4371 domain-containing protein n=1 Tax=Mytilus edulis TaxID=6550 RepID=A0A8S3SR69_MYTED|nr:unnamed protein product [Mytilus edulis]